MISLRRRYDHVVTFAPPMTLTRLAVNIAAEPADESKWRLLLGFLDEYQQSAGRDRLLLIAAEPAAAGDRRWDVMLAAVAEHLAYQADSAAPAWVRGEGREWLGRIWWVVPLASARPWALAHSPASFRRRGIFLHPDDLAVA